MTYALLEHPQVSGRGVDRDIKRAADAATEVHDVEMTKEQYDYMHKVTGQKQGSVQPKEVRRRKRMSRRSLGPEGGSVEEQTAPEEDVYVFQSGLIDAG